MKILYLSLLLVLFVNTISAEYIRGTWIPADFYDSSEA